MKIGLKYTFKFQNNVILNNIGNILMSGCGAGGFIYAFIQQPSLSNALAALGFIIKGLATFTAEDESNLK